METQDEPRRVLIVKDEPLVAMHLEDLLIELGHEVIALATRLEKAMSLAREGDIDFAILDLNLAGTKSFPVADILRERGIPFLFATGYGSDGLVDGYREELTLGKPYDPADLQTTMARAIELFPIQRS